MDYCVDILWVRIPFDCDETVNVVADTWASSEERWRSEGVQPGGPRSRRGVVGTWFDKDHDPHGPAGPTAFWKVAERPESDDESDGEGEDLAWLH